MQLPKDITDILNKGTNFIPTATNLNPTNLKSSIRSEVNTALNNIITKHPCNLKMKNSKPAKIFKITHPYRRKINPTTLLQQEQSRPNFNLIEYVHKTHSYSKEHLSKVNFNNFNTNLTNIEPSTFDALRNLQNNQDIL